MSHVNRTLLALWSAIWLLLSPITLAEEASPDPAAVAAATESVEQAVESETRDQTAERRKQIMHEAVDALAGTKDALKALEEERVEDALEALALTTGKLELIVAREPALALAPTDVTLTTHDVYGTTEAIREAIKLAEDAIDDGKVQKARRILDGLGSEVVITVTNLPLATYPEAIKAITPLIDDGQIDAAKRDLQAALNTVVLTRHVLPLPVIRAESLLERAEALTEKPDRADEENEELKSKLAAARAQLQMAQILGYGDKDDYKPLFAQLKEIEKKTKDGQSGKGFFDKMKTSMTGLWDAVLS